MTGADPRRPEGRLPGTGGVELYWRGWLPVAEATGTVLVSHGLGEHGGRYAGLAETLTADGWAVYAPDHRGHGLSTGCRCDGEHSAWIPDLDVVRRHVAARHPGLPLVLLGHSMGGHLALAYALDHAGDDALAGLVLSAPALVNSVVPDAVVPLLTRVTRVLPTLRVAGIDESLISKDPAVVAAYRADPLVHHGKPTLRLGAALFGAIEDLLDRSARLRLPVLLQHGEADRLVEPVATRRLAERLVGAQVTVRFYEGLWHELYNEPERGWPLADLREWLSLHRASRQSAADAGT